MQPVKMSVVCWCWWSDWRFAYLKKSSRWCHH